MLNAEGAEQLIFDDSLDQSRTYSLLLHLLRIMPLWIRETRNDLESLRTWYTKYSTDETIRWSERAEQPKSGREAHANSADIIRKELGCTVR